MISRDYIILAPEGIHARPATALVRIKKKFRSDVILKKEGNSVKLESILNILSLAAKCGETVSVIIEGEDEVNVAEALDTFFNEQLKSL